MTCDETRELLIDYIEGELPRRQAMEVQAHVEKCATCRRELTEIDATLKLAAAPQFRPSDGYFASLYPRVMLRIDEGEGQSRLRLFFQKPWRKWGAVLAPTAIAAMLVFTLLIPALNGPGTLTPDGNKINTPPVIYTVSTVGSMEDASDRVATLTDTEVERLQGKVVASLMSVANEGTILTASMSPADVAAYPAALEELSAEELTQLAGRLGQPAN